MTNFPELNMTFNDLIKVSKVKNLKWVDHHIHNTVGGGIYRMWNIDNEVIYVGKSVDVHRRLHEHYSKKSNTDYFIDEVVKHEVLIENNPIFQNLLESIFIAFYEPKYNDEVKESRKGAEDNGLL